MDLRIKKTRNSIINAFIELRAVKPLEKITVKELTEKAQISKQTFYLHYQDIYDLSEQLEDEAINALVRTIPNPDFFIDSPAEATMHIYYALLSQGNMFNILFSLGEYGEKLTRTYGNDTSSLSRQYGILADKLESKIKQQLLLSHPEYETELRVHVNLTMIVNGCINTFYKYHKENSDQVISILADIVNCISSSFITS